MIRIRHRDLLVAIGVDAIDREALAGLPVYLHSLELKLAKAQDELADNDHLSDAVGDAFNIVRALRLTATEGKGK